MDNASTPVWARAFAALYDPVTWVGERAGLGGYRRELLGQARGRTVEIGAGTGANLPYYPAGLRELVRAEPDPTMRTRLERKLRRSGRPARLADAPAERLPLAEGSIDTVVSTLVLCTVDAPDRALAEIRRLLRPDGQLLFIEHVRADSAALARWQDRLAGPWRRFARGCRCNRATAELLRASGFEVKAMQEGSWRAMPPIVRPLVVGRAAVRPAERAG
jgi:SAM-dependent methyltransferase